MGLFGNFFSSALAWVQTRHKDTNTANRKSQFQNDLASISFHNFEALNVL